MRLKRSTVHKWNAIGWLTIGGPITYAYPDSIGWVAFMSLANLVVGEIASYHSARAEENTK